MFVNQCAALAAVAAVLTASSNAQTTTTSSPAASGTPPSANPSNIRGPTINVNDDVTGALNATAWSLIYAYPLYIFGNFAGNVLKSVKVNEIFHQRALASPDSPGVIKPNIDTLYSRVVLDLSQTDVVLTVPNITDGRYWVYPIYDPYGNNVAEIGNVNGNSPGDYLIRRSDDLFPSIGYQNVTSQGYWHPRRSGDYGPGSGGPGGWHHGGGHPGGASGRKYQGIVNVPTTYATMLIRLFVLQNTTADLNALHTYQNASKLTLVNRTVTVGATPSGNLSSLAPNGTLLGINSTEKLLNFTASFIPYNQPENFTERARVAGILGQAGIYNGRYHRPSDLNLTQASQIANDSITADLSAVDHIRQQSNGWQLPIVAYQGNYGLNYAPRAYVAIAGYQQQTVKQTLYPGYKNTGFTSTTNLTPNTSALFTFSRRPQLKQSGFWSLAVYGADQYLIKNDLFRFEIGDRSTNLTFQDGSGLVYGPQANTSNDGPFQVLLQPANQPPPANWTGNWLPADESFSYILRWYVPQDSMTNGSYIYPKVDIIPVIV